MSQDAVGQAVAEAYTEEWGRVVATLIRVTGDWDLAEECAQDAFTRALERWPRDGVPRRPGAWLTTTARNRAVDRLRREATEAAKLREVALAARDEPPPGAPAGPGGAGGPGGADGWGGSRGSSGSGGFDGSGGSGGSGDGDDGAVPDDRLRLIFTCCHPALPMRARVALTLRTLAGLSTAEIARAFLVSEGTMGQRLTRAKNKIRHAAIPFRVPPAELLPQRTSGVLAVLYLLYSEGYAATSGAELLRTDLSAEAIRLARILAVLVPRHPEAGGLLALMLLQDARRAARTDPAGDLVLLEDQDRTQWDRAQIAEGLAVLDDALRHRRPGPYQIQAAIAACHVGAERPADTDWPQIALLYGELARLTPGPVVELNRAAAVAMADGPAVGLALLDRLTADPAFRDALGGYHLLPAARADLLRRLGRKREAAACYREALALVATDAERRFLGRRLAQVSPAAGSGTRDTPGTPGTPGAVP